MLFFTTSSKGVSRSEARKEALLSLAPRLKFIVMLVLPPSSTRRPEFAECVIMSDRLIPALLIRAEERAAVTASPSGSSRNWLLAERRSCTPDDKSSWHAPCMILDAMDLPELFGPTNTFSLCCPMVARLIGPIFSNQSSLNCILTREPIPPILAVPAPRTRSAVGVWRQQRASRYTGRTLDAANRRGVTLPASQAGNDISPGRKAARPPRFFVAYAPPSPRPVHDTERLCSASTSRGCRLTMSPK